MKIALFGYGKMGHMIEESALARGHEVVLKIDVENRKTLTVRELSIADVAIEFSTPDSAVENIRFCMEANVPVVVGTTGWYGHMDAIKKEVAAKNGSLLYASNFSLGVNILFGLNKMLAKWMAPYNDYLVEIEEIHHTKKLDAPSGTAITLAEGVLANIGRKKNWQKQLKGTEAALPNDVLNIVYERSDNVPGIHKVKYRSAIDEIQISHEAFSRQGFALGAVLASEFLKDKKGVFTAQDIFGF